MKRVLRSIQDPRLHYYRTKVGEHGRKYANFHRPSVETLLCLIYAYDKVTDVMESLFNQYALSSTSFNALMILSRSQPHGCIQQDLSKLLLVSRANVTGILKGLVKQGLVSRNAHPSDRRAYLVRISRKGEDLLKRLLPKYHRQVFNLMSCLNASQKKSFKDLLVLLLSEQTKA